MNISESQNKAVGEFVDLIASKASSGGRAVHPETAISSAALLAGSLMLRSFNLKIGSEKPGTIVLSNEANEKWPQLASILAAFLSNAGIPVDMSLINGEKHLRGEDPKFSTLEALSLLQDDALSIVSANNLSLEQASQAAALATAFIVKECTRNIALEVGVNVAIFGFIEGSKTVPPALMQTNSEVSNKKSWYKVWK